MTQTFLLAEQYLALTCPSKPDLALVVCMTPTITRYLLRQMTELRAFATQTAPLEPLSRTFRMTVDAVPCGQEWQGALIDPAQHAALGQPTSATRDWEPGEPGEPGYQWLEMPRDAPIFERPSVSGRATVTEAALHFSYASNTLSVSGLPLDERMLRRVLQRLHSGA